MHVLYLMSSNPPVKVAPWYIICSGSHQNFVVLVNYSTSSWDGSGQGIAVPPCGQSGHSSVFTVPSHVSNGFEVSPFKTLHRMQYAIAGSPANFLQIRLYFLAPFARPEALCKASSLVE